SPSCVQLAPGELHAPKRPVVLPEFPQSPPMQTLVLQPALPWQLPRLQAKCGHCPQSCWKATRLGQFCAQAEDGYGPSAQPSGYAARALRVSMQVGSPLQPNAPGPPCPTFSLPQAVEVSLQFPWDRPSNEAVAAPCPASDSNGQVAVVQF